MTRNVSVPAIKPEAAARVRSWLIHEDRAVLAFDKPSGVPVQTRGGRGESLDQLLWAFARSNGKRPKLVHRLDAATSGVIVAAQTQPAAAFLSAEFSERRAGKTYLALVRGDLPVEEADEIDAPIRRSEVHAGREVSAVALSGQADAKPAVTQWRILARSDRTALVELKPETGRMHQLRVHMAHLGCPILGDDIYGAGVLSAPRLMLHAARLEIGHPDGGRLDLRAPMPEEMLNFATSQNLAFDATEWTARDV